MAEAPVTESRAGDTPEDQGEASRLLLVRGPVRTPEAVAELQRSYDVELAADRASALRLLEQARFDGVLCSPEDFAAAGPPTIDQKAVLVLNTIGEGACVVESDDTISWMNRRMADFAPETLEHTVRICTQAKRIFETQVGQRNAATGLASKKFTFSTGHNHFEIICSPVISAEGRVEQVVAVVWDASSGKRLQAKIDAIDAAGRELARIDQEAISGLRPQDRLKLMQEKIIHFSKDLMHFDHFAIRVLDRKSNRLEVVISEGLPEDALQIDLYATPEGNGISGYVGATGRSYICHDVEKDGRYVLGLDHSKSSLTVPLNLFGEVVGTYNIESDRIGAFTEDDRQFAEIFGRYVAMTLNILDLLVVERYNTSTSITDSFVHDAAQPVEDILCEVGKLEDQYVADEELRGAIERIKHKAGQIRDAIDDAKAGPNRVIGCGDEDDALSAGPGGLLGMRILVADDEVNIRKNVRDVLEKRGCTVTLAKDGQEACGIIDSQTTPFDLVLSDIKMPYRNGYEIFAAVQRKSPGVPVILMTGFGYDPHHSIVRASQDGLSGVLFKPFKVDQLIEEVENGLAKTAS